MSIKKITTVGAFLAFTCIISAIPLGVNILGVAVTLQTFAIAFAGYVLGHRYGAATAALYVVIGLVLPVYSNMTSGLGVLMGPTGGFLWGFIPLAYMCGRASAIKCKGAVSGCVGRILLSSIGLIICYGLGIGQFVLVTDMDVLGSGLAIVLPYLPKDICMLAVAYIVGKPVRRAFKSAIKE